MSDSKSTVEEELERTMEEKLIKEFSSIFPGYRIEKSDDEGLKLLRVGSIETEDDSEDVWIATVYEMGELFMLFELNRQIVNERHEVS